MNLDQLLTANRDFRLSAQNFISEFLEAQRERRFVLGLNAWSKSILPLVSISAIVDDFTQEKSFQGVPIIRSSQLAANSLVVNCSTARSVDAQMMLDKRGLKNLNFFAFQRYSDLRLLAYRDPAWDSWLVDIVDNWDKYSEIRKILDNSSQTVFDHVISFRTSCDVSNFASYTYSPQNQYFENFLRLEEETFFDVGAYDGETSAIFAAVDPNYKTIHAFEPDDINIDLARKKIGYLRDIHFHEVALSDSSGFVRFNSGQSSSSRVSVEGNREVMTRRGDEYIGTKPSYIKMDIEGLELDCLFGFRDTISTFKPKLAISIYHDPKHIWSIPQYILQMNATYRLALRHYTQGPSETVMYFY